MNAKSYFQIQNNLLHKWDAEKVCNPLYECLKMSTGFDWQQA